MARPDIAVKADGPLGELLQANRIQKWRIPILVANGGVQVLRRKRRLKLADAGTPLKKGDSVRIVDPMPAACVDALQREANTKWRDYAIVPGATLYDLRMEKFIKARTDTIEITNPLMWTLKGFIDGLATSDEITNPIRHLVVVGHASFTGLFKIALFPSAKIAQFVAYEDLETAAAAKTPDQSIVVDVSLMMPRPVEPDGRKSPPELRLIGCEVGGQAPYMLKFKEALGGKIVLTAPKRRVIGATLPLGILSGEIAYMAYHFKVYLPTPKDLRPALKTKRALIDELVKRQKQKPQDFTLENGKQVSKAQWDAWVPRDLNAQPITKPGDHDREFKKNPVRLPIPRVVSDAPRHFAYVKQHHLWDGPGSRKLDKDTGVDADRKQAVKETLQKLLRFTDRHPFPEYVRYGYDSLDDFMEGWNWQFSYDKATKVPSYDPIRDEYHIWEPITRLATNTLVMNYYPTAPAAVKSKNPAPIIQLNVGDAFFFGMY